MFDLSRPSVAPMTPRVFAVMPIGTIIAWLDSKHAFHAADRAAHHSADHRADRPSNAAPLIRSMCGPAGNTLCLRGERCGKSDEKCAGDQELDLHRVLLRSL